MKKLVATVAAVALGLILVARPAAAGHRASHLRWEGAAIALGTLGLIAVLGEAAGAQPVAVAAGAWYPGYPVYPQVQYCPPQPRVWIPGYWEEVEVWVPGVTISYRGGDCREHRHRHRGHGRHGDGHCGDRVARDGGGHYERQRVWREGHYR